MSIKNVLINLDLKIVLKSLMLKHLSLKYLGVEKLC